MGRKVLITGASSGIGAELSRLFVEWGDTVIACARSFDKLDATAERLDSERFVPFSLDVTDITAVEKTVAEIEDLHGPIDLALLNAGTYSPTPAESFGASAVHTMMDVNVVGISNMLSVLMPEMMERGRGQLALMSSVAAYRGLPMAAGYSASKAAVIAMGESLKAELDGHGVKLQVICPGFVKTPLTEQNTFPMPYLMDVDDAARRIMKGLESSRFQIAFPRRFVFQLKLLQMMPDALYFPLIKKAIGL
ncbi:SDR family NAD(P)-dependent oxidoreductase [Hwanghaeella grinnelliae]|uniref:SDR family NAD(P)-dependent oxidoreductase n=1 Tax=Hwanghaeella grinnelliae TaxID=2500179 RepID=A0A3S2VM66_9PROT|nr:SDR family NAD(P)-dependent oxidoreductase [Hwanghaeella grinnelliae]RVU33687.1 SDR family NAD(P)-dependent oxidoreductase [Hwanghaeella grinnelliae]